MAEVMAVFGLVFMVIATLAMAFCVYMMSRNECVYRFRIGLFHTNFNNYLKLPPYDHMVNRFWVWPLERFLK